MTRIVTLAKSPALAVGAGLSAQEIRASGNLADIRFVGVDEISDFWLSLQHKTDERDRSLLILGLPPPSEEVMAKMKPNEGNQLITYIPNSHNALNIEQKSILRGKGIFVLPERETYDCFLGDIRKASRRWLHYSRLLSLHQLDDIPPNSQDRRFLTSFIQVALEQPTTAANKVSENGFDYFEKNRPLGPKKLSLKKLKGAEVIHSSLRDEPELVAAVFDKFLEHQFEPIGVIGDGKWVLTNKPTYVRQVLPKELHIHDCVSFGKGAMLRFNRDVTESDFLVALGKCSFDKIVVEVKSGQGNLSPSQWKALKRRILGGENKQVVGNKSYLKRYHSIRDRDPEIRMEGRCIFATSKSFEEVVGVLRNMGVSYRATPKSD